jgi:hypothetical protein
MITIDNHGPLILASNYWGSEMAQRGLIFCSPNAGCIRVLVPASKRELIEEARKAQYVILSRGPWLVQGVEEGIEILLEDGSDSPYAIQLTPESWGMLPAEPPPGQEWVIAFWDLKKGKPHKAVERKCHWRRVPKVPWLKPVDAR